MSITLKATAEDIKRINEIAEDTSTLNEAISLFLDECEVLLNLEKTHNVFYFPYSYEKVMKNKVIAEVTLY